jgi:hypothetical protein
MRFPAVVAVVVVIGYAWDAHGLWRFAPLAAMVGLAYGMAMVPAVRTPPLGDLIRERVYPALSKISGLSYVMSVSPKLGTSVGGSRTVGTSVGGSRPAER